MLSFAVTHQDEGGCGGKYENAFHVFISEVWFGHYEKRRGNGSAALCAVSNWIWQYII